MSLRPRLFAVALASLLLAVVGTTLVTTAILQQQGEQQTSLTAEHQLIGATTLAYNELQTELSREQAAAKYLSVSQPVIGALVRQSPGTIQDDVLEPYRRTSALTFVSLITPQLKQVAQAKTASPAQVTTLTVLRISLRQQYDAVEFWDSPKEPYAIAAAPVLANNVLVGSVIVGKALNNSYVSDLSNRLGDFQAALVRNGAFVAVPSTLEHVFTAAHEQAPYPAQEVDAALPGLPLPSTVWHATIWRVGTTRYLAVSRPLDYDSKAQLAVALPVATALPPGQPLLTPLAAIVARWLNLPAASTFTLASHLAWWLGLFLLLLVLGGLTGAGFHLLLRPLDRLTRRLERFRESGEWTPEAMAPRGEVGRLGAAAAALAGDASAWRAELRGYRGRLQSVLDSMGTGVVVSDAMGRVELINPVARELLGIDAASAALPVAVPRDGPDGQRIQASNGRVLNAVSTPIRRREGDAVGLVTVLEDVTREHELERVRSDFLSVVSHELRTPLTTVKGSLDLLVDGEAGELDPVQQRFLQTARRNTERLIALVNDLLDLSRIESGQVRLNVHPIDLRRIVDDVVLGLGTLFDRKRQELHLDLPDRPLLVQADRRRFEQVVLNLLSNAVTYTPEEGKVWVTAQPEQRSGQGVLIVRDSGPGISPEDREHLFEKFYRGGNALTRPDGGSGLGLAIVKSLVDLHHGTITVESTPGEGAVFAVRVPLAED